MTLSQTRQFHRFATSDILDSTTEAVALAICGMNPRGALPDRNQVSLRLCECAAKYPSGRIGSDDYFRAGTAGRVAVPENKRTYAFVFCRVGGNPGVDRFGQHYRVWTKPLARRTLRV
jgi:hypothetical protein